MQAGEERRAGAAAESLEEAARLPSFEVRRRHGERALAPDGVGEDLGLVEHRMPRRAGEGIDGAILAYILSVVNIEDCR